MNTAIKNIIAQYIAALQDEKGYADHTITNYALYLERFGEAIEAEYLEAITLEDIDLFRQYLIKLGLSRATQAGHLIAVRSLFRYAAQRGYTVMNQDAIGLPKFATPIATFLEPSEVLQLLDSTSTTTPIGLRDKAVLETLFATGLRVQELQSLNLSDINLTVGQFNIMGKGMKIRTIFLTQRAVKWLSQYTNSRQDSHVALFINYTGNPERLNVRSIQRLVKQQAKAAGLGKHVTPHTLRHSYATNLLNNGCDIRLVQELLGHAQISTTQIYTHLTSPQLKEAHTKYMNLPT